MNHFKRLLECAITKYYSNMVRKNEDNPRPCGIPQVLHRSLKIVIPDYTTINNLTYTFGKYVADKIAKLRSGLLSTDADAPVPGSSKNKLVSFRPMSEDEVLKIIKSTMYPERGSHDSDLVRTQLISLWIIDFFMW